MANRETVFLVERYWPGVTVDQVREMVNRLAAATNATPDDDRVRHLGATLVPGEEYLFCLFSARSSEAVAAVNQGLDVPFDRIVAACFLTNEAQA